MKPKPATVSLIIWVIYTSMSLIALLLSAVLSKFDGGIILGSIMLIVLVGLIFGLINTEAKNIAQWVVDLQKELKE